MIFGQTILNAPVLFGFCAMLGLVWSYFLFTHKRGNTLANKFLSILIAALAILAIRQKAAEGSYSIYIWLYYVSQGVIFLIGPALYFHIKVLLPDGERLKKTWLHFLPAFISTILMSVLFAVRSAIPSFSNIALLKFLALGYVLIQLIHLLTYVFMTRRYIRYHDAQMGKYTSALVKINKKWVKNLTIVSTAFCALIGIMYFLIISGGYYEMNNSADTLFLVLLSIILMTIIVKSWRQPEVTSGIYKSADKYQTSKLSDLDVQSIKQKLVTLVEEDKPFLDPELSLKQLADKLQLPAHNLSQLINQEYNLNFSHFINESRIDYAVDLMKRGGHKKTTLEGIAYDSGFNSKSTFNRAFKRKLGCSPREFCDSMK